VEFDSLFGHEALVSRSAEASPDWSRLDSLVKRLSGSGRTREPAELREFWRLYRAATSRLATLQAGSVRSEEEWYLNRLVAAAHGVLYRKTSRRGGRRFLRFLSRGWPALVRANAGLVGLAVGFFLAGGAVGAWYAATDPGFVGLVAGPDLVASVERGEMWTDDIVTMKPVFGAFIFSNNLLVGILAFAFGVTAGAGTAWILFSNGVSFGAITWAVAAQGMGKPFWGFVLAHGALEFPAIFFAGAAGLAIARGQLFPGALPRGKAVAQGGRTAIRLLAGAGVLFLVAAAIEAWFSPEPFAFRWKVLAAVILSAGLAAWLAAPPREEKSPNFAPEAP
jgi:uncharacterized membrane protein SpoIIM required for sporulation